MTDSHIIIAGQSNALGYLNDGPAPYCPTARVQIWTDTDHDGRGDAWNYMLPGTNTGTLANPHVWGAEVEIANRWLAENPTGYLWIEKGDSVKGSTGLAEDAQAFDWSPRSDGEMYDRATAGIDAARSNLDGSPYAFDHWDAVMWMQGETDATSQASASAYGANLAELVSAARADWSVTQFVVGRISEAGAYSLDVRQAQWALDQADDDLVSFKTIGLEMRADGIHVADQIRLGGGFFNAWEF